MKSAFYLGLSLLPLVLTGCQTTATGETHIDERARANIANLRPSIQLADGGKLTFNIPSNMQVVAAQGFESSGIMFSDESTLVRIAVGSENGSVSCLPDRTCREFETQNVIGKISFYLEHLASPRSGEDIMHPTNRSGRFPIAIRALTPLGPQARLFVEGFCMHEETCEKIASSFDFSVR